ncbi:MAG: nucleoside-diphosphate kinase [Candidatus Marsarchaeota archaeon]|jgi:nucleoside-diphosphate kinase|nr:nucleoside-diphosphate kinase [Candidatus Marsarchaeota archaeon]
MEKTLVLIKPDGIKRGIVGKIINKFEVAGLKIIAIKMVVPDEELLKRHYKLEKEWYENLWKKSQESAAAKGQILKETPIELGTKIQLNLINSVKGNPIIAMIIEGNEAIANVRKLVGATSPSRADPSTIRGMYSTDSYDLADSKNRSVKNIIHASDSIKTAEYEINLWFKSNEIIEYKRADEDIIY